MKRTINVFTDAARVHIPNTDAVDISRLEGVINCSIDTIFNYILEYISPEHLTSIMDLLLDKLRPEGNLIIRFANITKICETYTKNEISDKDFLGFMQNKKNILSIDRVTSIIKDRFVITKIDYLDNHIIMIIQRKSI
jgi:predicted SAM-dependent methyltransferase